MPAAPLVAKKLKAGSSSAAIGMELDRRAHVYANEIHPERTPDNLYWVDGEWVAARDGAKPEPLDEAIERRMGELNTKRKIRADAVKAEGFVLSSNAQLDEPTAVEFLKEGVDWMAERYGRENILAAAIHVDEDTPHAQFWIAPVIHDPETGYDRLSGKELFTPNKVDRKAKKVIEEGTLTKLQRDFYREVSSRYGFSEPFTADQRMANGKVYKSQAAYKADKAVSDAREELEAVRGEVQAALGELGTVQADTAAENERLEWLRQARREAEGRVGELGERIEAAGQGGNRLGGEYDAALGEADAALGRAKDLVAECQDAVSKSFKGRGVPECADSRDRESAARAAIGGLRDRLRGVQQRLGDLLDRFAVAVRDFGRGWGLLSKRGAEIAREQHERDMDSWGVDLDSEVAAARKERTPMRLADLAKQVAADARGQVPSQGRRINHNHGAR